MERSGGGSGASVPDVPGPDPPAPDVAGSGAAGSGIAVPAVPDPRAGPLLGGALLGGIRSNGRPCRLEVRPGDGVEGQTGRGRGRPAQDVVESVQA